MKSVLTFVFLSVLSTSSMAQRNVADSAISTPWIGIQYGFNYTSGDLIERYGHFNHLGLIAGYKTKKNWVFGVDGSFMFGSDVNLTGLFDHLVDSQGKITDQNGDNATVIVSGRGFYTNATIGKIIPVLSPNKNSGIFINFGAGFLLHKLRVETQDHVVPVLELDYKKGYDRLSSGANVSQFLGYAFMANEGVVNFFAGFYVQEGYTFNQRTIFFDTPDIPVSTEPMLDIQFGAKVGWLIPIYKRLPKEFYYN